MNEIEIYKKYVDPIYGHLTSRSEIYQQPTEVQLDFKNKVNNILNESTDHIIKTLIQDSNWRCSLVGSWLTFLKNKTEFTDDIGKFLIQGKNGTIGYCFTLAKFGTLKCSEFLTSYLIKKLQFEKYPYEEFQDTAIYALTYIDNKNHTKFAKQFLEPDGLWTKFIEFEYRTYRKMKDHSKWGVFDRNYQNFVCMMDFMNKIEASI